MTYLYKIATAWDATPVLWVDLNPPMFKQLANGVDDNWDVPTRTNADLSATELPALLTWLLAAITPAERTWLHANILTATSTNVTIVTPDHRRSDSANRKFNAIAYRQPLERNNGRPQHGNWHPYTISFRYLVDIGAG